MFATSIINAQNKTTVTQYANTSLSNLTSPTKIKVNLLPDISNAHSLGNSTKFWKNIYFDSSIFIDSTRFITIKTGGFYNTAIGFAALNKNTTGNANTAVGFNALMINSSGISNTAIGASAMSNSTGSYSTAIGAYTLSNSTGNNNTAVGSLVMIYNSTGTRNTAVGQDAMHANIDGGDNTATGNEALAANTSGGSNVATGSFALWQNTDGSGNTALGSEALYTNNGNGNTSIGNHSLQNTTTGSSNTALGEDAGTNIKTGSNNIFIGANTNSGTAGALINSAAIGYNVTVTTNNSFVLGNAEVNRWGFGVEAGSRAIRVGTTSANGNGAYLTQGGVWTNTSARNKKENFQQQDKNIILQKINQLEITKWKYKGTDNEYHYGPMADDFHRLFGVDDDSSIADMDKTGVLFLGMQQLIKINKEKDASIDSLKSEIANLKSEIENIKAVIVSSRLTINKEQLTANNSVSLQQNIPNPFSNSTTINYSLPQHFTSAKIIITDKNGNTLKQINLSSDKGSANINAVTLSSGAYQYSLIVDGKLIGTKQMVLSK